MNEDKAVRYHRLRRRASVGSAAVAGGMLLFLLGTGGSAALRDHAAVVSGQSSVLTVVIYAFIVTLVIEVLHLPLAFYQGVALERRYELSTEAAHRWWFDRAKALLMGLPLSIGAAVLVWTLVAWSPEHWWALAAACFTSMLVGLAGLAPVLLLPIHKCEPLRRPELTARLVALAHRAGARVLGVFEWNVSARTRKAKAVLAGFGRGRRILLSDTLLTAHSDDEVEVILAHELSHHVHHDIWKALWLEAVLITLGFYLADRALETAVGRFGIAEKSDVAGLPVLVVVGGAVSIALRPLTNALSRAHERRADRFALEMTGNATAFISAMKRLAARNLAEERPSRLVEAFFHSHPSIAERLEAARTWAGPTDAALRG